MTSVVDEWIEMRNLRFHFRDWAGPGPDAPDLVLLHGFTGHARSWDRFAETMSDRFRVLALDQRGHGESGWAAPDAYGNPEMVADVAAFAKALGLNGYSLLGLSMGGMVAIAYAGQQSPELARLVIVDIAPEIAPTGLANVAASVAKPDVFDSRDEAFAQARANNPVPPEDHHRQRVDASLMRTEDGRWTWRYDRALRDPNNQRMRQSEAEGWRSVSRISVPTLLVRGENSDILDRDVAEKMAAALPRGTLVEVPGSGHPVPLDKPDGFLDVTRAWLLEAD